MRKTNNQAASAKVEARVDIRPMASQAFLVSLSVFAGIAIVCGTSLLAIDKPAGWGLVGVALIACLVPLRAWMTSQSDMDLSNSHPTTVHLPDGTSVSTDSRTLRNAQGLRGLVQLCAEVLERKPLPPPDGFVNGNMEPIVQSASAAHEHVTQINNEVQEASNKIIDIINAHSDGVGSIQGPVDSSLPTPEGIGETPKS